MGLVSSAGRPSLTSTSATRLVGYVQLASTPAPAPGAAAARGTSGTDGCASKLVPLAMSRQPKWQSMPLLEYELQISHPEHELQKIRNESKLDISKIQHNHKLELSNLDDQFRRIEEKVRWLGDQRMDMVQTLEHLKEATVPAHEREEEERKAKQQEAKKKFGGMIDE